MVTDHEKVTEAKRYLKEEHGIDVVYWHGNMRIRGLYRGKKQVTRKEATAIMVQMRKDGYGLL